MNSRRFGSNCMQFPTTRGGRTARYQIGRDQSAGFISVRLSRIAADSELAGNVEGEHSDLLRALNPRPAH
jgi:hypothetical protein